MAASKQASIFSRESGRITYLERENSAKVGLEHLKVITWMTYRQVANYQQEYNLQIPLPDRALESVGANREQWRKFWGE
jgi:hypothetical protein